MAPSKASRNHDDHRLDAPAKEKNGGHALTKMRRGASQQTSIAQHRGPPSVLASAPAQASVGEASAPTIPWSSLERRALHAYLREHDLNTPASYASSFHHWVLAQPGSIGLHSPTMVRKRQQVRRQSKDQLAMAVRKHFNGLGIQENDVIVDFIYKVRNDKVLKHEGPNKQGINLLD